MRKSDTINQSLFGEMVVAFWRKEIIFGGVIGVKYGEAWGEWTMKII